MHPNLHCPVFILMHLTSEMLIGGDAYDPLLIIGHFYAMLKLSRCI